MEEDNGLSFMEVLKVIFKRIWWVLGATAACLLIVVLVTQLWYNKRQQFYSVSYEIVYPDSASGKYPDGSDLLASDAISSYTLTAIKNGEYSGENPDEFKSIDVEKMLSDDGISIAEEVTQNPGGSIKRTYTLTVSSKYFSGDEQAVAFIRTVAAYPVKRVNSIIDTKEYGLYFSVYEDAKSYEAKIEALLSQKNYLEAEYTKLNNYGSTVEVNLASLHNLFTSEQRQALADRITANYYVFDADSYKANAETRKEALNKQKLDNKNVIDNEISERDKVTTPQEVNTNPYDQIIADLIRSNTEIDNEISKIDATTSAIESYTQKGTKDFENKQAFDAQLEKYRSDLSKATDELKTVSKTIYGNNSRVIFSSNRIGKQGGMSAIVAAALGAVIGLLVSAVIVCIIDLPKYKRNKLAKANAAEPEVQPEAESVSDGGKKDDGKND